MRRYLLLCALLLSQLIPSSSIAQDTVADQYKSYVERLTYNDVDDLIELVERHGDTLRIEVSHEIEYGGSGDPPDGPNPTNTVSSYINTDFIAPKVSTTNLDLEIPIVNDKSLDAYSTGTAVYVTDDEGIVYALGGLGNVAKKIIGNSDGVIAYEESVGDNLFVWQNGVEQQLTGNNNSNMTERVVSMQDGYVVYESYDDDHNDLYIWKDGQQYVLDDMQGATSETVLAVSNGIIAYQASDGTDTNTYIWKDGQSYQIDISDTDVYSEQIVSINDGKVIFESTNSDNSDINSYVWEDGLTTQLTSSIGNEKVVAVKDGIIAYETTSSIGETVVCVYKDGAVTELSGTGTTDKLVAINDDGSVVYTSSGNPGDETYLYSWKDGEVTYLNDTVNYFGNPEALDVKDGKVAYETHYNDETHAYVYQDGFKYELSGNEVPQGADEPTSYNERIVSMQDDMVVYESYSNETYLFHNVDLFVFQNNYSYKLEESEENNLEEIVEIKDGMVAYQSTARDGKTDAFVWTSTGGAHKLFLDDDPQYEDTSFIISGITDGKVLFESVNPSGDPGQIFCWENSVAREIHARNVNDGQPENAENKIVAFKDGKVYFTSSNGVDPTQLYVWENGMASPLTQGYNLSVLGISGDTFYFTNGTTLYEYESPESGVEIVDTNVTSSGIDMNGEVYYTKGSRSQLPTKWTLSRDGQPYQISDTVYTNTSIVATQDVDAYGPRMINELYAYNASSPTDPDLIDEFISRPDPDDGSYLQYSSWTGEDGQIIPVIDTVTNDIAYTKMHKPVGGRTVPLENTYFEGPVYYDTNTQLLTLYPELAELQSDLQHDIWFLWAGLLLSKTFSVTAAPTVGGSIELYDHREYDKAFFDDGSSLDIPLFTGFDFDSAHLSGPIIDYSWDVTTTTSNPLILLFSAVPEGETDSEVYALYFNYDPYTYSSSSGDDDGDNDGGDDDPDDGTDVVPESLSMILLGLALLPRILSGFISKLYA